MMYIFCSFFHWVLFFYCFMCIKGMDEGVESTQVAKMKAIAAEKRLKRDAKRAAAKEEEDDDDESDA